MSFELLNAEVEKGLGDFNRGIPMGFDRLTRYVGIRKGMYYLIGGNTGSGKTSFIDDAFVLNPVDWAMSKEGIASGIKVKVWYRSMERSIIPVGKILGWNEKMTKDEHDLFLHYRDYVEQLSDIVTIIDGPENPVGIAKELKNYALENGRIEQLDQWNKIYVPNDPTQITMVVIDHIGLLKTTTAQPSKKEAIDKMSDELRYARDFYGYSPVVVSQFNRSISNPSRLKNGDVEPQLEDFADSSSTQNDADVVMALFDPMRYKVADPSGYDLDKLKDQYGAKYFRSLRLIKNSYGEDDVRIGLGFLGQIGMFKELNRKKDMTDADYESVVNKTWFLR
jgi:hypothetical protein